MAFEMAKETEPWIEKHIDSTFVNGVTKLIILGKISHKSTYPYELFKQLKKHHFGPVTDISKSDVYNVLNALESRGLVRSESKLSGAKVQKKYSITPKGAKVAKEAKKILTNHLDDIKKLIAYEFQ